MVSIRLKWVILWRPMNLSYRNQSIDLPSKLINSFLYERDIVRWRVKDICLHRFDSHWRYILLIYFDKKCYSSFRINGDDRDTLTCLPFDDVGKFYQSWNLLLQIITDKNNELQFKLTPGNLLIVNNWR